MLLLIMVFTVYSTAHPKECSGLFDNHLWGLRPGVLGIGVEKGYSFYYLYLHGQVSPSYLWAFPPRCFGTML